jgi:hypothetical protein
MLQPNDKQETYIRDPAAVLKTKVFYRNYPALLILLITINTKN